jgi:hypothetical protein
MIVQLLVGYFADYFKSIRITNFCCIFAMTGLAFAAAELDPKT